MQIENSNRHCGQFLLWVQESKGRRTKQSQNEKEKPTFKRTCADEEEEGDIAFEFEFAFTLIMMEPVEFLFEPELEECDPFDEGRLPLPPSRSRS